MEAFLSDGFGFGIGTPNGPTLELNVGKGCSLSLEGIADDNFIYPLALTFHMGPNRDLFPSVELE
jgi:hypothetical protein